MESGPKKKEYTPDELRVRANIKDDWEHTYAEVEKLKQGQESELTPQKDWATIWVLSGPERAFDDSEQEDERGNQNMERFVTGAKLAREVAAKRMGKESAELTDDDIRAHAPVLYYNGRVDQNEVLRGLLASDTFSDTYHVPKEVVRVAQTNAILHTGHQFEDFPQELVPGGTDKLVIVSDYYHLPRVKRYLGNEYPNLSVPADRVVLYPGDIDTLRVKRALSETKKIPSYTENGTLPKE